MTGRFSSVLIVALALGACTAPVAYSQAAATAQPAAVAEDHKVFVIRHLQKADGDDPSLTAEGSANAQRLAKMLGDRGITAIFATPTRRAMETATPLAKRLGFAITPYDPRNPDALVKAAASAPGPILVVGHSNTVSDLVDRFGGAPPPPLTEEDYGTLYVVGADGEVAMLEVR